jgi:hypothetical protein
MTKVKPLIVLMTARVRCSCHPRPPCMRLLAEPSKVTSNSDALTPVDVVNVAQ